MVEGLRKPETVILIVVILLSYGCPPQAIVHAFGIDERTVARWQKRAGLHCQSLHQGLVMQKQLDLEHVQADEIRVKGCKLTSPKRASWLFLLISLSFSHFLAAFAPHPPLLAFSC